MKIILGSFITILSLNTFAADLRCVSLDRTNENQVLLQGSATKGQSLYTNLFSQDSSQQIEFRVEKINSSVDFVEIQGTSQNLVFIGGGQMSFQLILPHKSQQTAKLTTKTEIFNQESQIKEIELVCDIENLYQTQPVSL